MKDPSVNLTLSNPPAPVDNDAGFVWTVAEELVGDSAQGSAEELAEGLTEGFAEEVAADLDLSSSYSQLQLDLQ